MKLIPLPMSSFEHFAHRAEQLVERSLQSPHHRELRLDAEAAIHHAANMAAITHSKRIDLLLILSGHLPARENTAGHSIWKAPRQPAGEAAIIEEAIVLSIAEAEEEARSPELNPAA
jgi:hypothetical protein